MVKLTFKAHKIFFSSVYKNVNSILQKKQRKTFKKARERYQNLYEKEIDNRR